MSSDNPIDKLAPSEDDARPPAAVRSALVGVVTLFLQGRIGVVEVCSRVSGLASRLPEVRDAIFVPFVAVYSETEDLPSNEAVRATWDQSALAVKEEQVKPYLEKMRGEIEKACIEVAKRYTS